MEILSWIFKSFCVWETLGKLPPTRWHQSFSNANDPLVCSFAFLGNDLNIHILLAALAVAVASLNHLKIQLWLISPYRP